MSVKKLVDEQYALATEHFATKSKDTKLKYETVVYCVDYPDQCVYDLELDGNYLVIRFIDGSRVIGLCDSFQFEIVHKRKITDVDNRYYLKGE